MSRPTIAVIGSGIAGMGAAWLLQRHYPVTLYEAAGRIGGHTNTVEVDDPRGPTPVDTGFIVHNRRNYPHLCALFDTLGVATQPGEMSFAVSVDGGRLEYSGTNLNGLFGQRSNLARPGFHRMLFDIARFNRTAKRLAWEGGDESEALEAFLARLKLGADFRDHYLLPMAAAIWSCPTRSMLAFPAVSLARFFDNHGLLNLQDRPQWRTVTGGSAAYVRALTAPYAEGIRLASPVARVLSEADGVRVIEADGSARRFDQVVIAAHADEARRMLPASDRRAALLASFRYQANRAVLHSDRALMPRRGRVWSSWNYLASSCTRPGDGDPGVSVTYWMNLLQRLDCERDYFVSLNPLEEPARRDVIAEFDYSHPVFDAAAMAAQRRLPALNGERGIWLAGSYLGYGFHEDALRSAVDVARRLGAAPPWDGDHDRETSFVPEVPAALDRAARVAVQAPA